jgi:hypothetical protein
LVLGLIGCTAETELPHGLDKAVIDVDRIRDNEPWPVTIDGDTASVMVPFIEPLPKSTDNVDIQEIEDAIGDAVDLTVKSDMTGVTATITTGTPVAGSPDNPGEFSWTMNDARDEATLTLYNESDDGRTLKTDRTYTVQVTVTENAYVGQVPATSFKVQPE